MQFSEPSFFYLLLFFPLIAIYQYRKRRGEAIRYSSLHLLADSGITWRQRLLFVPPLLQHLGFAAVICCLARPQVEVVNERQDRQGIAIEMIVDISSSMDIYVDYEDTQLTRMAVAKKVVENFVAGDGKELPGRPDDLIGVISFARYADPISPLTLSHKALVQMVRELTINNRPNEDGTAYGDATALAAAQLKALESSSDKDNIKSKIIVLLTDGENNCGDHMPLQAAALAQKWGIRIYTISLQKQSKAEIKKGPNGKFLAPTDRTKSDRVLEKMATMTGGIYRTAHDYDSLQAVYKKINTLEKTRFKAVEYSDYEEAFSLFALAALALFLIQHLLTATLLRVSP